MEPTSSAAPAAGPASSGHTDLKKRTARGALASIFAQAANFVLRTGSMFILARLLAPEEFGLVGMVLAFTGFLTIFKHAGLSAATIQRGSVTDDQISTLFWINLGVGAALTLIAAGLGPVLARFYSEPRLVWVTVAMATGFLFSGAAAQHQALLMRRLRFVPLAVIDVVSLLASIVTAIIMAVAGFGYWSLVAMMVMQPAGSAIGAWVVAGWIPGPPRRQSGVGSLLRYGGSVTLNAVIVYVAYNAEKALLGRFWGAAALGIYGRAYQLISLPGENLKSAIGSVVFPALSRVQNDPPRLRSFFLKAFSLFLALILPIAIACALFSDDIVLFFLGPKWDDASDVFRLLAPTMVVFALINPFGWLMHACGHVGRSVKVALMIAPVVIIGYLFGLAHGPEGVAAGYSIAMIVLAVPVILLSKHNTPITTADVLYAAKGPFLSGTLAAVVALATWGWVRQIEPVFIRLFVATTILFVSYGVSLLYLLGQWRVYFDLLSASGFLPLGRQPAKGG